MRHLRLLHTPRFQLPQSYRPNSRLVQKLPFKECLKIWWRSLDKNNLLKLQTQLLDHSFPKIPENDDVAREVKKTPIGKSTDYINEVVFRINNGSKLKEKHVVVIHGYGASLGCFARNFHVVNKLKGHSNNFVVHFLDNVSFGLSSNPRIPDFKYRDPIPEADFVTIHDSRPDDKSNLYKKYYKLVDGFDVDVQKQTRHRDKLVPVLTSIENYYLDALESWRASSGIEKIDYLIGHSFGGYWCGSYAARYPQNVRSLVLLSPVGMERTAYAVTAPEPKIDKNITPTLDPTLYSFLSRFPLLSKSTINFWYYIQPYMPRFLKYMGPWGVEKYYNLWYGRLFAINKVIRKLGGALVFTSHNELKYGTNTECRLLIEYLYNSITSGTVSDIHIKYLLTPSTTSRWPLYDKLSGLDSEAWKDLAVHVVYGQYDFMNSEAGEKLVDKVTKAHGRNVAHFHTVPEGGHNLYIQNPFGTNDLLAQILKAAPTDKTEK